MLGEVADKRRGEKIGGKDWFKVDGQSSLNLLVLDRFHCLYFNSSHIMHVLQCPNLVNPIASCDKIQLKTVESVQMTVFTHKIFGI